MAAGAQRIMLIICPQCGGKGERLAKQVARAARAGRAIFCGKACASIAHRNPHLNKPLTSDRLRALVHYDPITGHFRSLITAPRKATLGTKTKYGYIRFSVDGIAYMAHRLAWLYVYGSWPADETDHVNGNRSDNRIANLRAATKSENLANSRRAKNNTTGFKGVDFSKRRGLWRARIGYHGRSLLIGHFETAAAAHAAYIEKARELFGAFARAA